MKRITILTACISFTVLCNAQSTLNSADPSNLNAPANAQPVPKAITTERSAPSQTPLIPPPANPVPPIYPGGDIKVVETQRNLILPAAPPSPTQPLQREPLTPVESNNTLNPTRPQRDEASRANPAVGVPTEIRSASPDNVLSAGQAKTVISATSVNAGAIATPGARTAPAANATLSSKENIAVKMDRTTSTRTTTTAAPAKRTNSSAKKTTRPANP